MNVSLQFRKLGEINKQLLGDKVLSAWVVGVGTASNMPPNLVSLYLAGSGMLVRNKKITATAQWEERTLRNPKPTSARVSVKRQVHMHQGQG